MAVPAIAGRHVSGQDAQCLPRLIGAIGAIQVGIGAINRYDLKLKRNPRPSESDGQGFSLYFGPRDFGEWVGGGFVLERPGSTCFRVQLGLGIRTCLICKEDL